MRYFACATAACVAGFCAAGSASPSATATTGPSRSARAHGMKAPLARGAEISMLQLRTSNVSMGAASETAMTCSRCVGDVQSLFVSKVWCPATQTCHESSSAVIDCGIPINSKGQCWAEGYAHQLGDFLTIRPAVAAMWASQVLVAQRDPLEPFPTYPSDATGMFEMGTGTPLHDHSEGCPARDIRIALVGNWGSGTGEAKVVADLINQYEPHISIHLGGVYYAGSHEQFDHHVRGECLNDYQEGLEFPKGKHSSLLMGGTQEAVSGYGGMVAQGFPYTGQAATYGVWQSDRWRIIALDSAYESYTRNPTGARNAITGETDAPQPEEIIRWLKETVRLDNEDDTRGIVFLTHHPTWNGFGQSFLGSVDQLKKIVPAGRTPVWFSAHENILATYEKVGCTALKYFPRQIGNGGFANQIRIPRGERKPEFFDDRKYQKVPVDLPHREEDVGFNGYVQMHVNGDTLHVWYGSAKCKEAGDCDLGYSSESGDLWAHEVFGVDAFGNVAQSWLKPPC